MLQRKTAEERYGFNIVSQSWATGGAAVRMSAQRSVSLGCISREVSGACVSNVSWGWSIRGMRTASGT